MKKYFLFALAAIGAALHIDYLLPPIFAVPLCLACLVVGVMFMDKFARLARPDLLGDEDD